MFLPKNTEHLRVFAIFASKLVTNFYKMKKAITKGQQLFFYHNNASSNFRYFGRWKEITRRFFCLCYIVYLNE